VLRASAASRLGQLVDDGIEPLELVLQRLELSEALVDVGHLVFSTSCT
jgi:hypothetical protein